MRFDLVVNTFAKDALLKGKLSLHGGGWMWRPLVDVQDVSDALICAMEAPADLVRGEVFNVLHSNYQIRELALLVAGSVQLMGRQRGAGGGRCPDSDPQLRVLEHETRSDARLDSLTARWSTRSTSCSAGWPTSSPPRWPIPASTTCPGSSSARNSTARSRSEVASVLVTGAGGQLGSDICRRRRGQRTGSPGLDRDRLDIIDTKRCPPPCVNLAPDADLQLRRFSPARRL